MRDIRNNPESRFYKPPKMQDINTEGTYWEQPDIDIVTQLEIDKGDWKDWIHSLIENTAKLEKRIKELEEKAKPRKPKSCETCEEYSPYCYACQQQFILLL